MRKDAYCRDQTAIPEAIVLDLTTPASAMNSLSLVIARAETLNLGHVRSALSAIFEFVSQNTTVQAELGSPNYCKIIKEALQSLCRSDVNQEHCESACEKCLAVVRVLCRCGEDRFTSNERNIAELGYTGLCEGRGSFQGRQNMIPHCTAPPSLTIITATLPLFLAPSISFGRFGFCFEFVWPDVVDGCRDGGRRDGKSGSGREQRQCPFRQRCLQR